VTAQAALAGAVARSVIEVRFRANVGIEVLLSMG